jgi:Zn-dependent M16 (insulinase) family peptidase
MRVLNQVLSTDWLQTQIRVIGGAYGGYSTVTPSGFLTFNSYRDPNLRETLQNFAETPAYLEKFEAAKSTMTRYIIGTISSIDHPLTPFQKGEHAFSHYFTGRSKKDVQADRDAVLSTTDEDIRNFAGMIRHVIEQNHYCVYGNEEKIRQEKDLFDEIIKIEK